MKNGRGTTPESQLPIRRRKVDAEEVDRRRIRIDTATANLAVMCPAKSLSELEEMITR
jgi:hypothetical protein